jgi:GNAT superfamily N-acetyltransferase
MTFHIRKAQPQDATGIADVLRDVGWFAHINDESPEATIERIGQHLAMCLADNSHSIYLAENAGIVGYAAVHWLPYLMMRGPEGFVSELFIAEAARGQGIGAKLLKTIEEEARIRGCSRLGLINSRVRESYQREFYKKNGWIEREDMVNFVLPLNP